MTWQTVLYFISILLTCILTGFLAWYVWRQPAWPGSRYFVQIVISGFLLSLTEVFSILSGTQSQALAWFNLRFLFTASIPILWLSFVLEYNGRKDWLSKRLLAGMFIIPLITQIMIWNSGLHGLWVKQEVAFHQNGPFWIAETSARIPGLWFMVHSFYNIILLLIGIGVVLFTSRSKQWEYRWRGIMLSAGVLVSLVTTIIPVFNLLPQSEFNPFVPSLGISALFYFQAIFRFQFLKHAPTNENTARMTNFDLREKNSLSVFIFVFILFATGIAAASYITYQNYEKQFRAQVDNQLMAIGALKVEELQDWRNERLADASLFYQNENFSVRVQNYFENPQDAEARIKLLTWMEKIHVSSEYDRIFLLDARGVERVSIPAAPEEVPESLIEQASVSLTSNKIIFLDFHRHSADDTVHLSMLVPVFETQDNQPLGVLVLRINPSVRLYPFIQRWPVPSQSAETLLVRRDGEDVLYLNNLKFELDTALNLHIPLENESVIAVNAVLGKTGVSEGVDYRGVAVVADINAVPNSPWFLISKMDTAEVYAPLRARLWQTIFFFATLILAAGAGLMLLWRQQQMNFYRGKVEAVEALRASEEKFRLAFDTSPDALTITRLSDGMFVSVNKGFEQITGYTREQVIGKTSTEISIWKDSQDRRNVVEELLAVGEVRNYEAPFLVLDGEIYGSLSAVSIELNGEPHVLNITRDITARRRAEQILHKSEANLSALIENTDGSIWAVDKQYGLIVGNGEFHHNVSAVLGRRLETGESVLLPKFPSEANAEWKERYDRALQGERFTLETMARFRDEPHYLEYRFSPIRENGGEIRGVTVYGRNITERKQAEDALIQVNDRLALAQRLAGAGIWDWNFTTGKLNWSPEFFHLFGLDPAKVDATFDTWRGSLHPDDVQSAEQRINDAIRDHVPLFNEYRIVTPSGETRWIGAWGDVTYNERGEAQRMTGICIDITERKQMDEKLRESEEKFRQAFNTSPIAISITRLKSGKFVSFNKSFEQMSGYSEAEIIGKTAEELNLWKSPQTHQDLIKELRDKGEVRDYETPIQSRNGEIYCLTSASLIEINGEPHILTLAVDITKRKRAENELRVALIKYKTLFDCFPLGITVSDDAGNILETNSAAAKLLSVSEEEHKRRGIGGAEWKIVRPDGTPMPPEEFASVRAFKEKSLVENVEMGIVKDDATTWISVNAAPLPVEGYGVVVTYGDISERKRAEDALRESETFIKTVLDNLPVGVAVNSVEPTVAFNYINDNFVKFYRTTREKLADPDAFWDAAYEEPEFRETMRKKILDDLASGDPDRMIWLDIPITRKGEETTFVTARNISIPNQPLMISTVWDVTERKQAEEKLAASEVRYRRLFEASRDGILILDVETGMILDVNPFLIEMLGYPHELFLGKNIWEIGFFKDIAANKANFLELQQQEYIRYEDLPLETAYGGRIHVEFTSNIYHINHQRVVQCNIRDITERKQAREKLLEALQELKRSNMELEQFAYIASHDLQEPLRAVAGMVQLLQKRYQGQLDQRADEYISLAIDGATRMQTLINDLLAYSRVERRGNPIQSIDANKSLASALRNLQVSIAEQGATITNETLPTLEADPTQLTQLFQNLIGNAIKFHGENPPQIHIAAEDLGHSWRFSVRDNGIGIEPQYFDRIFLVFQRLHTRREYSGTGIGLSVCKKIVERHGGRIWIESQIGQGSTFYFTIPHRSTP